MTLGLAKALESGEYSDFTITCQGQEFRVHRVIVASASPFFAAALEDNQGFSISVVDLPEDDPSIVKQVLDYINTGRYAPVLEVRGDTTYSFPHAMFSSLKLFAMAVKFDLKGLQTAAAFRFQRAAISGRNHVDFPDVVDELYSNTSPGDKLLRDFCLNAIVEAQLKNPEFLKKLDPVMRKHPDIAIHLLQRLPVTMAMAMMPTGSNMQVPTKGDGGAGMAVAGLYATAKKRPAEDTLDGMPSASKPRLAASRKHGCGRPKGTKE